MKYSLELTPIERDSRPIYRVRMHWFVDVWHTRRKSWKYKVLQNAVNKLHALVTRYGQPEQVRIFDYDANLSELGLRIVSGPAEPL